VVLVEHGQEREVIERDLYAHRFAHLPIVKLLLYFFFFLGWSTFSWSLFLLLVGIVVGLIGEGVGRKRSNNEGVKPFTS
jgi:hypothetical protein